MTKLDKLIQELCPDGVIYRNVSDVAGVSIGEFVHKSKQNPDGKYPVYNGGTSNTGYYDDYNRTANKIIISARGANAGFVNRVFTNYWSGNSCYTVDITDKNLDWNFAFYWFKSNELSLLGEQQKGGIPAVSKKQVERFRIPVPPLPVQREIVRILDNFAELTAVLTAELTARKKQYAYYRDKLLTHSSETKICKLADVCESIADGDHMPPPKADDGIPFITISNITEQNKIDFSNTMFVPSSYYDALADKRKPHSGDILYTVVGSYGIPVCIEQDTKFVFQRHIAILRPRSEVIKARYMFHAMQSGAFKAQADKAAKGAAQKTIGLSSLAEMTLPVPNMCIQERLIRVLDNFDAICTDLNIGLPAEIEARQKQYEYYRDKLLTFKTMSNQQ